MIVKQIIVRPMQEGITNSVVDAVNEYTLIREPPSIHSYSDLVFLPGKHMDKQTMVVGGGTEI